uniref:Olfactory receptor n=1 Tax=Sphaeramia orbicularis TaxID=375764 RepID=A0A672YCJ7_9TELE
KINVTVKSCCVMLFQSRQLHNYRFLYFVIMFTAYILIICGNCTILCLIWFHQNLHEPMYVFIAALLLNSVVYCTTIYPKLLTDVLSEEPVISYSTCVFQWFAYYTLMGSEYCLLSAMAYDRYVSICKPLHYPVIMRKLKINIFLALSWFLPAFQVAVPAAINAYRKICHFTLNGTICNSTVIHLYCIDSTALNIYGLVCFVNLLIVPLTFILFTYIKIFIITHSCVDVRKKATQTCLPHLLVLVSFTCATTCDVLLFLIETDFSKPIRLLMSFQTIFCHPLFNPVIYGLKMTEIFKHFKRLLCPGNGNGNTLHSEL